MYSLPFKQSLQCPSRFVPGLTWKLSRHMTSMLRNTTTMSKKLFLLMSKILSSTAFRCASQLNGENHRLQNKFMMIYLSSPATTKAVPPTALEQLKQASTEVTLALTHMKQGDPNPHLHQSLRVLCQQCRYH